MKIGHYDFTLYKNVLEEKDRSHTLILTYKGLLFTRRQEFKFDNLSKPQAQAVRQVLEVVQDFTVIKKHLKKSIK